jgi:hypothetical protein
MKPAWLSGSLAALVFLALVLLIYNRGEDGPKPPAGSNSQAPRMRQPPPESTRSSSLRDKSQERLIRDEWATLLQWLSASPPPTPDEIRERLLELRSLWAQFDPHVLAATIASLLQSHDNATTGLPFRVGPQGFLSDWPDLRTFLVDALAMADPEESAKIARSLLRETDSSAEFAVAIRSLTRGGESQATAAELLSCLNTLLSRREWQGDAAMAESLDLARFLGNREAASALLGWNGHPQARDMALHEFAADHPAIIISTLSEKTDLSTPQTAALMARADPSDPAQAAVIDSYLRNPDIPLSVRTSFLSLYPLRSLTTGYRLYRGNPAPYDEQGIRHSDEAALAQAESWLQDPALAPLHPALVKWKNQLIEWRKTDP